MNKGHFVNGIGLSSKAFAVSFFLSASSIAPAVGQAGDLSDCLVCMGIGNLCSQKSLPVTLKEVTVVAPRESKNIDPICMEQGEGLGCIRYYVPVEYNFDSDISAPEVGGRYVAGYEISTVNRADWKGVYLFPSKRYSIAIGKSDDLSRGRPRILRACELRGSHN